MDSEKNYDDLLYPLLCNEDNIFGFFDRIFDFLNRRTDFFKVKNAYSTLGLEPGEAENIIKCVFCKYMQKNITEQMRDIEIAESPPLDYIAEEVITASESNPGELSIALQTVPNDKVKSSSEKKQSDQQSGRKIPWMDPDCYNGAHYDDYSWAQTIRDIDVQIKVPKSIITGKQVRVSIQQNQLKADALIDSKWTTLKEGSFPWKINVEDSTWTLVPREHIHVCLQKLQERWWDSLFLGEPKVDLKTIDPTIAYEDLDQESQAKIEELMYNEQMKRLGKPTIQQDKIQNILKEAWNTEGSPFKGKPYDPTILDVQSSEI